MTIFLERRLIMSKETDHYQKNLEMLCEAFPNKKLLCGADVAKWAGLDRRTVKKHYFSGKKLISLPELAEKMS